MSDDEKDEEDEEDKVTIYLELSVEWHNVWKLMYLFRFVAAYFCIVIDRNVQS